VRVSRISLLGKQPMRADFIATVGPAQLVQEFDSWLLGAMEWALARRRGEWPALFAAGRDFAFVFNPQGAEATDFLVGTIKPSHDSARRQFPLAAAAVVAGVSGVSTAILPLVLELVWAHTHDELWSVAFERTSNGLVPELVDAQEAAAVYRAWAAELNAGQLWAALYGVPEATTWGAQALVLFGESVAPHRALQLPETGLTLRLPLGELGGAAVCFWLDVLRRVTNVERVPNLFWSHEGQSGTLLLHIGKPPLSTLAELWRPTQERLEFCDLCHGPTLERAEPYHEEKSHGLRAAADPNRNVGDMLERVSQWANRS
jgi:type VI secretion system protein ImpM